jgi:hypothetical protein
MTDYRLGLRPYARHWLGLARAVDKEHPGGLNQEWKDRLDKSLADLNADVYGGSERFDETKAGFIEQSTDAPVEPGTPAAAPSSEPAAP